MNIDQALRQAVEHHQAGRQEEAVALYQSILLADPRHAEANNNMEAMAVALYEQEGLRDGLSGLVGLVCGGQRNQYDFHKIIFDEAFLTYLHRKIGFKDIRRWDWRTTEHAHIDDFSQSYIPHMDKQSGRLMSLNLEAVK